MPRHCFRSLMLAFFVALALPLGNLRGDDTHRTLQGQELREHIGVLIAAMGSDEYVVREQAQNELARLGTVAFDDLLVARENADIEISQRAQYLIERMGIELVDPNDSPEVRQTLGDYDSLDNENRIRRMQRLALLPNWDGTAALCRLVRYDDTEHLSKTAALLVLQQAPPESPQQREELAETIEESVLISGRTGADWARGYADTLRDPVQSLPTWEAIVEQEWNAYRGDPRQVERILLRDLLRWQVALLLRTGNAVQAEAAMESTLALVEPSRSDVLETIDWLLARQAWPVLEKTYERFGAVCEGDPEIIYRHAEILLKQGRPQDAAALAGSALAIEPTNLQNHELLARALRSRGMFDWAEAEFHYVLAEIEPGTANEVRSRFGLADLLHDQLRDGEAAEVLEPAVEALRDPIVVNQLQQLGLSPNAVIGRAHYFSACHFAQQGDLEKQASHLQEAVTRDPYDLDSIIALYNMPNEDEARQERTLNFLNRAREALQQRIVGGEQRIQRDNRDLMSEYARKDLASYCNQYAWLVCNTEGDLQHALECSERSIELIDATGPRHAGYLDTLSHCYFALGDYAQAVECQQEAVELEPHSGALQRALERFEAALAEEIAKEAAE